MERGDNVQRLSRKLAAIKKKRVRAERNEVWVVLCVVYVLLQVRVRERAKRRRREMNEEKERNEKRAEEWMTQKRQERLKEETVNDYVVWYFCRYSVVLQHSSYALLSTCIHACIYITVHVCFEDCISVRVYICKL